MSRNSNEFLFYDGYLDALEKSIACSGKPKKIIATAVYPGRQCDTAKSLLSRAMSPENTDVRLNVENTLTIMKETRPEDFIFYLCDEFGFERPVRKSRKDLKQEIETEVRKMNHNLTALMKRLEAMPEDEGE